MEDYRKHLYDALNSASRDYDQAILTLAAGTLALSVTFAHDITPHPASGTGTILFGAWAGLVVSVVAILISFLTSQRVLREAIERLDHPGDGRPPTSGGVARLTEILNGLAGGALIAGLALLGWYALANS